MSFDNQNPTQQTELKTEVETDPITMGYVVSNTSDIINRINTLSLNVVPTDVSREIDDVAISEVSEVIDETEYAALDEYDKEWIKAFIEQPVLGTTMTPYKTKFLEIFPNGSATRTSVVELLDVLGTRAEVLWGYNTVITREDWTISRELG